MEAQRSWIEADLGERRSGRSLPAGFWCVLCLRNARSFVRSIASFEPNVKGGGTKPPQWSGHTEYPARVRVGTRSKCPRGSSRAGQARVPTATTPGAINRGVTRSGISRVVLRHRPPWKGRKKRGSEPTGPLRQRANPRPVGRSSRQDHPPELLHRPSIPRGQSRAHQSASHRSWGRRSPPYAPATLAPPASSRTGTSQEVDSGVSGGWPLAGLVCCTGDPTGDQGQAVAPFDSEGVGWWRSTFFVVARLPPP